MIVRFEGTLSDNAGQAANRAWSIAGENGMNYDHAESIATICLILIRLCQDM